MCASTAQQTSPEYIFQEPGMVQWLRVETRDRDPDLIPCAGGHFRFGCGVQIILARSLHTPHAVLRSPSASSQKVADFGGPGYGCGLSTMCASTCSLERITLSTLKTIQYNTFSFKKNINISPFSVKTLIA